MEGVVRVLRRTWRWVVVIVGVVYSGVYWGVVNGFIISGVPQSFWFLVNGILLVVFVASLVSGIVSVRRNALGIVESIINSAAMRGFLLKILRECNRCGRSHMDAALARIGGEKEATRCFFSRAFYRFLHWLLNRVLSFYRIDEPLLVRIVTGHVGFRRGIINLCTGIAHYGFRKPLIAGRGPLLVVWDLTRRCNLKCVHCYSNSGMEFANLPPEAGGDLSFEQRKQVIDELADSGVVGLAFSGGEPMMADRFWDLARYAKEKGFLLYIATNGTLIKDLATAQRLKDAGVVYVEVSLDHVDSHIHDVFRGVKGAWNRAVTGIKSAAAAGIYTVIATILNKMTYDETLEQMFELRRELGANNNMFFNFVPTGRGKEIIQSDLSPEEREHAMEIIYTNQGGLTTAPQYARYTLEKFCEKGFGPIAVSHLVLPASFAGKILADLVGGCGAGRIYCAIEANGDIQPCVFLPVKLGNAIQDQFQYIWKTHPILREFRTREHLKGNCAQCEYRIDCGGCRARAWGYFQDLNESDPGCIRNQKYWDRLKMDILTEEPTN